MVTRQRLYAVACVVSVPLTLAVACSFPDVGFDGDLEVDGGDGGGGGTDAPLESAVDAELADVIERDDASQRVDASDCEPTDCDCDKDGYLRADAGCDAGAAKLDCDDYDPLRNPGIKNLVMTVPIGHNGDWNCDDRVDVAYKQISCPLGCSKDAVGYEAPPPTCGEDRDFFHCAPDGLGCQHIRLDTRKQGCK